MEQKQENIFLKLFLDFGEKMLESGAEIGRVEDSLCRLGKAYGATQTEVFAITSSIVLTLTLDDVEMTGTRRIRQGTDLNFAKVDALNSLCRSCAECPLSPAEFQEELDRIDGIRTSRFYFYLGSALAAGAFSLFFGGAPADGCVSALFGLLVCFLQLHLSAKCPNKVFFLFLSSLLCGSGIYLLGSVIPFLHTEQIIIGDIMLLVPGIAITGAVRDMVIGDTISGATKLLECLMWAGALAAGFMIAMLVWR